MPCVMPSATKPHRLAKAARPTVLESATQGSGEGSQAAKVVLTLVDKLLRLCVLPAHSQLQEGDDLRELAGHEIAAKERNEPEGSLDWAGGHSSPAESLVSLRFKN